MKTYFVQIESASPISYSKYHGVPLNDRETHEQHEKRTWREKALVNKGGVAEISAMAFKFALCSAAKYLGLQIPGKGKRTYSKIFDSAILITDNVSIGINKEDLEANWVHVNSDGKRGSGSRVMRCFPTAREWNGVLKLYVLDDAITEAILKQHLEAAGMFIGVGQFRVERGGTNGRFKIVSLKVI